MRFTETYFRVSRGQSIWDSKQTQNGEGEQAIQQDQAEVKSRQTHRKDRKTEPDTTDTVRHRLVYYNWGEDGATLQKTQGAEIQG